MPSSDSETGAVTECYACIHPCVFMHMTPQVAERTKVVSNLQGQAAAHAGTNFGSCVGSIFKN